ncbi:MAG TPA: CGNR zinc finger domain-containing protein [Streptosporangiaceae bacterium]|nr:CGNR zinc finger domain-containing protein [Streptosporangiaceae bacterium]
MTVTPGRAAGTDPHIGQAPGRLAVLQAFVNTLDIEQATDALSSAAALERWLRSAGLPAGKVVSADLALAVDLREALRGVLRSHVGRKPAAAAQSAARLARIASSMQARIAAAADGSLRVVSDERRDQAAFAELLLIAAEAQTLGTWSRLKVCSADDCQWAFYDRSPTRSGCWCSMQICGSRAKARAYRSRAAKV